STDKADIGRVRTGQQVKFGVDAYPDATFAGKVEQVRLQPVTNQNVVTYNTIITVDNKDLRLMPGMTATVTVIIQNRENALRLPAPALRFRPEGFEDRRAGRGPGGPAAGAGGPGAGAPAAGDGRGAGRLRPAAGGRGVSRSLDQPVPPRPPAVPQPLGRWRTRPSSASRNSASPTSWET